MSRMITYRDALNEAMCNCMQRDPQVVAFGIGVADHKRIFGSTKGLTEKFGPERCFDTPLSEDAMTGFALGAAINGLRPVHIHIRVDFMLLAMNQITNMIASFCYGSAGNVPVPLVIRAIIGRGWGQAWQHSKTLHSLFAHIPGLKVIMPSSARDAKGMLTSAIRDDNPVISLEHRWLYDVKGDVDEADFEEPLDGTKVIREGNDVTVLALTWMNIEALKAAEVLEKHGVSLEILDARSVAPFDVRPVLESVGKTGHLIIADYDWIYCGFGAEVATQVYDELAGHMKSPVTRLGLKEAHCPCTRPLENEYYCSAIDIIHAVEDKLELGRYDISGEEFYSYNKRFKGPF